MTNPDDGILNIDKAAAATSMAVVREIKRLRSHRHVGHGGTLDPAATGVLPICLGQSTRLMQFLVDSNKEYMATVHLGIETDTYDADGTVVEERDPSGVTLEALEAALGSLRGVIKQIPPMYSALKHQGRRLHELARAGIHLELSSRAVEVIRLELVLWQPPMIILSIKCGRGVYVRSLAHDLGRLLGCGAYLSQLRRLRSGPFRVEDAVSLERLKEAVEKEQWNAFLYPPDYVLLHMSALVLSTAEEHLLRNGQSAPLSPRTHYAQHMEACRAYASDGRFVALVRFNRNLKLWHPFKVFQLNSPSPYGLEMVST